MAAEEVHRLDVGTVFELTIMDGDDIVDISGAITKQLLFQKPDGTAVAKSASFTNDGKDGKIKYTTVANDLDLSGSWKLQGLVAFTSGSWKTDILKFRVYDNIE